MDQDYECRLLRQINIQNENASPLKAIDTVRALTPTNSPLSSPSKHGDRFIPSRAGANWSVNFHRINENEKSHNQNRKTKDGTTDTSKADGLAYSALLKNELLGAGIEKVQDPQSEDRRLQPSTPAKRSLFSYSVSAKRSLPEDGNTVSPYSLSPVSSNSQKLLRSPRKPTRKISKIPFKVLDAPELQDDFYLNLVDWSSLNVLSVGLGTCVYLWSACTSQVTRLCDLSVEGDSVTSVGWSERGNLVAVGTHKGYVQIWDAAAGKKLSVLEGHTARVGALAWNADQLSSGSRDRVILQRDIRAPPLQSERRLQGHRQEVCGLKWSTDHQLLASGGNDNKVHTAPTTSYWPQGEITRYTQHRPPATGLRGKLQGTHSTDHQLLASGGNYKVHTAQTTSYWPQGEMTSRYTQHRPPASGLRGNYKVHTAQTTSYWPQGEMTSRYTAQTTSYWPQGKLQGTHSTDHQLLASGGNDIKVHTAQTTSYWPQGEMTRYTAQTTSFWPQGEMTRYTQHRPPATGLRGK
ncbi:fizzy-related protein homolog isoform X4 [Oncorhynchus keta]|uniref:fizzy-related protein homolog isoform X4 n=1 Tax=Oncorhynchus keta TaxID=8018 RepID=UPI00227A08DA|nr:fizzy-related protein homolog isoform X4 [Oncorhynchus keta]XP_052332340.1 fizzy-related protein homolog isoform X4 [Oncorhynchus keta]XP_052332341.1 fizzy-related protein homolog isoform X5 [Oncorhynchus keta]XP_052332342.1 fizzy-related protein homolog isoform X4 [Oncorhynchus keta]XP_052332343.1 fizzy-related protein homolog isoform X4 [Oncorhynchus keta]XP_052332344.1 fizzy-related protein homolog isoform X4 [Oncorhynchus keta]XP_052332345.1 fizzy-related protein homolog isoform X4 [On